MRTKTWHATEARWRAPVTSSAVQSRRQAEAEASQNAFIGPPPCPQPAETVRSAWSRGGKESPGFPEPTADTLRSSPLDAPRAELGNQVGTWMARSTTSR